ncbi:acyl-CoA N-acyltransferase [Phascolomyces articulosus]|uniref:Acyl-CoA N-acyltransferase n=1 Tax=Phascolomyces articulosus TaxID=60185 RepID=A0AAD5JZD5_9FUNG|nr:acyl-CoA N-acyltransferase [Phascolomyces articulosus]
MLGVLGSEILFGKGIYMLYFDCKAEFLMGVRFYIVRANPFNLAQNVAITAIRIESVTNTNLTTQQFNQLVSLFQQLSTAATETTVRHALTSEQNRVLVAMTHDAIAGALIVAMTPCASGIRVHIEDVIVDDHYRRQGIATQLLQEGIQQGIKDFNARTIDLTSRPGRDAANRLYQKLGFKQRDTNVYRYEPKVMI